jgi:hypothetical protein
LGELILYLLFYAFGGIGFATGRWLLPRVSGGRLVMLALKEQAGPIWPWKRLPSGQVGVEVLFFVMIFAGILWLVAIALFIWFLCWLLPEKFLGSA